ncbi:RagB/SusD family nutrient uptake outer membrane protein [uncultured Proteiniphilum sp.]|uniref:RagB/SusD family nutrient uptake outer membrane protein n=1 Tax=uncultured Proteiniphilum sp. TaxID=497637 RepID=UPI002602E021|nr:RagB/SusD family nutrient uptake outer membrane protein [uncultured Proteiniphilum sp.]
MKKYTIYICLFVTIFYLNRCKDLDLYPLDNMSDATFWETADDFKTAANNLYNSLERFGYDDITSDIAFQSPNAVSNGSYQLSETSTVWTDSYVYIRRANNILEKAEGKTESEIIRFIGETKFFRAYNYWKMFKIYGGIPLIDKILEATDPELFKPRASRTETIDFILKDLDEAAKVLPRQKELPAGDIGRITQGAALSMIARVALFEGTWRKFRNEADAEKYLDIAIAASNEVISSGQYSLFRDKGEESYFYLSIEEGDDSSESILDRRYQRNVLGHGMPYNYNGYGYNPTRKLVDMYLDKNGYPIMHEKSVFKGYSTFTSEYEDRDPRMTQTMTPPGTKTNRVFYPVEKVENWPNFPQSNANTGYILYKYMSWDLDGINGGNNGDLSKFDYDKHLLRYAEVLLTYAEAVYERRGTITDEELNKSINVVRNRVNMPPLTNDFVLSNNLDMREEIRRERTVELALEGFRYDDLRRWKTGETELPKDIKGIKIKNTEWENKAPYNDIYYQNKTDEEGFLIVETGRIFDPKKHYLQPLPTKEVAFYQANGFVLEQNPNW